MASVSLPSWAAVLAWLRAQGRAQSGRLFLWTPVALGLGAAVYLGLKTEPPLAPAALVVAVLAAAVLVDARRGRGGALQAALVLAAVFAAGFTLAKLRSDHVAAPIVPAGYGVAEVEGWVVDVDSPGKSGPRLLVAPTRVSGLPAERLPLRLRIVMPPGPIPSPGEAIAVKALLDPPPGPAAPGAYDFARDAWFAGEGGVGLARDAPRVIRAQPAPIGLRLAMAVNAFRWTTAERLAADMDRAMGGHAADAAGLAVAVTTSHQDWLSQAVRDDLRGAGLAHMLAIAGLHTAALSGFVFFAVRFAIAAWPWLAVRVDGKKVAASAGLLAVGAYLVLSGAHAPARRAAITASVAFAAILLNRQAISLRALALAALIILLAEPEAVVQPGFEMSFCATASLVALAEAWPRRPRPAGLSWRAALVRRGRDWALAAFMVSLVAGAATGPFAIQHFNRVANFGVLANLGADLIASVLMMPALAVALALEPFGHGLAWPALFVGGWAARAVIAVGHLFATAPGAAGAATPAPQLALLASYVGILFACLWTGPLRLLGLPLAAAVALWPRPPAPVAWIAADGADAAIASQGREVLFRPGVRAYAAELWAQRRGLAVPADMTRARGALFDCDYWSCAPRPGTTPALGLWWTRRPPPSERLDELCRRSQILALRAAVVLPDACRSVVVLRPGDFAAEGAAEIAWDGRGWRIVWSQPLRGARPWSARAE